MKNLITLAALFSLSTHAAVLVKEVVNGQTVIKRDEQFVPTEVEAPVVLRDIPYHLAERADLNHLRYREVLRPGLPAFGKLKFKTERPKFPGSEVRTLIKQGPDQNRIIITVLGDGYTAQEKEKFFTHVQGIVSNIFEGETFKSYLPFMNVYAVFTPSKESGLTDRTKKDTVFGLYRTPVGSKRAIIPGKEDVIEAALELAPAPASYPIIIANDPYYGGLGGRYAITTSSVRSASIVLRHELGHNFSNVGEEYDGGSVYDGANFSVTPHGAWDQWKDGDVYEKHDAAQIFGEYIWKPLTTPFVQRFSTSEAESLFKVELSSVGWEKEGDVEFLLDGVPLEMRGEYTMDRSFFNSVPATLARGDHELVIRSNGNRPEHVLAFANGYVFPTTYDFDSGQVKAFSVFNEDMKMLGYRPTEHMCVMRDMLSKVFCPVDQENIWLQFLQRVSLIDSVSVNGDKVEVKTLPLQATDLEISWFEASRELVEYRGLTTIPRDTKLQSLKVRVKLVSKEVRKASEHFEDEAKVKF